METDAEVSFQMRTTLQNKPSNPLGSGSSPHLPSSLELLFNSPALTFEQEANCEAEQHCYGMLSPLLSADFNK